MKQYTSQPQVADEIIATSAGRHAHMLTRTAQEYHTLLINLPAKALAARWGLSNFDSRWR